MSRAARNERGAVAVVFAISAVLVFGLAALGVDLGNAMNRKKETQTSSDFAALAGANGLPDTSSTTVQLVADYLNKNATATDGNDKCDQSAGPVTVGELSDGNPTNGEVTFPTTNTIRVLAPQAKVGFGMANAIGFSDTCVQSVATARIASGGSGLGPYYATAGCSSGPQVLKSDAGGPSIPFTVPILSHDAEVNASVLSAISPAQVSLAPSGGPDGPEITVTGTNLGAATIDQVGFFNSDRAEPVVAVPLLSPAQTATSVSVTLPVEVASVQDVWWVRVHDSVTGQWSARLQAKPLLVGEAVLSCDPASSSGNFGSIDLPWGSGNDQADLEKNIADGVRPPTSLKAFPTPLPLDNRCDSDSRGVISTDALSKANTNCVQSVTGLKAGAAYDGYLKNGSGRLRVDTSSLCQSQGRPQRGPNDENSDILSCFLKNDTLRLSDTIFYTGTDGLFVQSIWNSPRFVIVPILDHDPTGTHWMPVVRFVAGFITDQPTGASRSNPLVTGDTDNGLVIENPKKLRAIRIFFFNFAALPPPPDGSPLMDYVGSGKKVITLVN